MSPDIAHQYVRKYNDLDRRVKQLSRLAAREALDNARRSLPLGVSLTPEQIKQIATEAYNAAKAKYLARAETARFTRLEGLRQWT